MSKSQTLRTLVTERLSAAAEEIFALFETTIAAYEEELCRSKEENQRKQQLLDTATVRAPSPGLHLNQEIITKVVIKEEPEERAFKQEEDLTPVRLPVSRVLCVKTEEASGDAQREDTDQERLVHAEDSRGPPEAQKRDTGADGEHWNQVRQNQCAPENQGEDGGETKKHECSVCKKRFTRKQHLDLHRRVHSGEKPYSCAICSRTFALKGTLEVHKRTHTGERPYSCSICKKTFTQTSALNSHRRTHTGERPFSCPLCKKTFGQKVHLEVHMRSHTGERPYSCSFCTKPFADSYNLKIHMRVHTGEKPYRCSVCQKGFTVSSNLRAHERTHTS